MSAQRQTYIDDHGRVCTGDCGEYLIWDHFQQDGRGQRKAKCRICAEAERTYNCRRCGDPSTGRGTYCVGCKRIVAKQKAGISYLVISDPDPLNPFKGGILPKCSFNKTLEMGNFDVGMVLEKLLRGKPTGKFYKVTGDLFSRQEIVRINGR